MAKLMQPIRGDRLGEEICKALDIEPAKVHRVIVDCAAGQVAMAYLEMYGSQQLLKLDWAEGLEGAEIKIVDKK